MSERCTARLGGYRCELIAGHDKPRSLGPVVRPGRHGQIITEPPRAPMPGTPHRTTVEWR